MVVCVAGQHGHERPVGHLHVQVDLEAHVPTDGRLRLSRTMSRVTHVEELKQARTIWQTVTDGRPYRGEFRILSKYDDAKWLRGTLTAALDLYGELSKIIFISHDITDQKRMEIVTKKQDEQYNIREGKLQ